MALLQRLVVHRTIDQAEVILAKSGAERDTALEVLRGDLLRFASRRALHAGRRPGMPCTGSISSHGRGSMCPPLGRR